VRCSAGRGQPSYRKSELLCACPHQQGHCVCSLGCGVLFGMTPAQRVHIHPGTLLTVTRAALPIPIPFHSGVQTVPQTIISPHAAQFGTHDLTRAALAMHPIQPFSHVNGAFGPHVSLWGSRSLISSRASFEIASIRLNPSIQVSLPSQGHKN
jgi:hypothetical protein